MARRQTPRAEHETIYYRPQRYAGQGQQPAGPRQAPPPPVHIPAPSRPATRRRWPWVVLLALLVLVCSGTVVLGGLYSYQRERIIPGVNTLGVRLGGQRVEEATRELEQNWESRQIVLDAGDGEAHTLRPTSLGLILDARETALAAYRLGRTIPSIELAIQHAFGRSKLEPTWHFDPAVAEQGVQSVAQRVDIAPTDATIQLVEGAARIVPGQTGRAVDVPATVTHLQENAGQVVMENRLALVMRDVQPAVTAAELETVVAELNERLNNPVTIEAYDPINDELVSGTVPPDTWSQWVSLDPATTQSATATWEIAGDRVAAYLQSQAEVLGPGRYFELDEATAAVTEAIRSGSYHTRLRVYHHDRQHTVQPGETLSSIAYDYGMPYPWIQHANPDLGDGLFGGQTITIPSPDVLLPLPVVENKRIVVSLAQQRMWAYENGTLKWEWPVSTGIDSSPTAPGVFQIQTHEPNAYASIWDLWMPNFMGIYRPVPTSDFMNGFHGFPTRGGSNLLWTNSLGRRVTYGCILVSNDNIVQLYDWADKGVIVEVQP
ncbi:MAG TPA: L,D-transpeptidase family protein [Candidatus Sulfomarinibacteraceae bacterium]|nr:L,D-transpeptidase family protein [Candidatus Sulfomarinibacteraceae bacterium]